MPIRMVFTVLRFDLFQFTSHVRKTLCEGVKTPPAMVGIAGDAGLKESSLGGYKRRTRYARRGGSIQRKCVFGDGFLGMAR